MRPSEQLRFWAHELAAIARTGLEFTTDDYDRDRYERTKTIAEGLASMTIDAEFTPERPYLPDLWMASPKVGCSVVALDDAGRVLLIKRADNGRWAIPGGVAEVGSTPSENALRELHEETGFTPRYQFYCGVGEANTPSSRAQDRRSEHYVVCFRARITGGEATPSKETPEVAFFSPDDPPADMSELQHAMLRDAAAADRAPAFQ